MATPVIIAAKNEAECIHKPLKALRNAGIETIVVANACDDSTAEVAFGYGAQVFETEQKGKLPAIQLALRHLGDRALDPVVTLDADTYPLLPTRWIGSLLRNRAQLDPDQPAAVIGSLGFFGKGLMTDAWRNATYARAQIKTRRSQTLGCFSGGNMLLHLQNRALLNTVLEMPNIWPGEDKALVLEVCKAGGDVTKSLNPLAMAITDNSRAAYVWDRLRDGRELTRQKIYASYLAEAPDGSIPLSALTH